MSHKGYDEDGRPKITPALLQKAEDRNCHIAHFTFLDTHEAIPEDADGLLALVPFLPRVGETFIDMHETTFIVDEVRFRTTLIPLQDGNQAVYLQPNIVAIRE